MTTLKVFTVEIEVDEEDQHTEAKARMEVGGEGVRGWGRARRNPADPDRPRVGDELAMARALSDLSHNLLDDAAGRIEALEGEPVELHL